MANNQALLVCFVCVLITMVSAGDMTTEEKHKITSGLGSGAKITDSISKIGDPKSQKIFNVVGKMGKFLGAAGGLVALIMVFLPAQESKELQYMKQQFTMVNIQLDRITTELDNIKDMIKYQNQRAVYISSASAILYGHSQMQRMFDEIQKARCSGNACKKTRIRIAQRYIASLDVKSHVETILHGSMKRTSVFGSPLLDLIKTTYRCDFSKINQFTNGILKLAFKGQQVVMTHEKLTGNKRSITESLNAWLKNVYDLRDKSLAVKQACFRTMTTQMIRGIRNLDYQLRAPTNAIANARVKSYLEGRYPWLKVLPFSYSAYGTDEHCVTNNYGALWNMPTDRNLRRRVIVVGIVDKEGTYNSQKTQVSTKMAEIARDIEFTSERGDYCKIVNKMREELNKKNVWKYISVLNIRDSYDGLTIDGRQHVMFVNKRIQLFYWKWKRNKHKRRKQYHKRVKRTFHVHVTIVLKSMEQANRKQCVLSCQNGGQCKQYPFSSSQYCQCKQFYQGNECKEHIQAALATTVDAMLAETIKLPVLTDIYFNVKDLRLFVGINFANVQQGVSNLEATIQQKYDAVFRSVATGFRWAKVVAQYEPSIQKIEYFAHLFERLPKDYKNDKIRQSKGILFANEALHVTRGVRKALFHINQMLVGKDNKPLLGHKAILLKFMEARQYAGEPCTRDYKQRIDNYWRKLALLQQLGFMVWAQALAFVGMKTDIVNLTYKRRLANQRNVIKTKTCDYSIPNSQNVQCVGHYLHPGMVIRNRCNRNYYVTGSLTTSCTKKTSHCRRCQCYRPGSVNMQCSDLNGKCRCKRLYYGHNCNNRDCVWGGWSRFGQCQGCGYGAKKQRSRPFSVHPVGRGKRCHGSRYSYASCFTGCCRNQFHCSRSRKCIPSRWKCNFDNNCGDNQDEHGCKEHCFEKRNRGTDQGGGNVVFLDRNPVDCPYGSVLKGFKLELLRGHKWRYWYKCCKLNRNVCKRVKKRSRPTGLHGKLFSLLHLPVDCPGSSYITKFHLYHTGRYHYSCCNLKHRHRRRSHCYHAHTQWDDDGHGNTVYLERHKVECRDRYFLSYFKLDFKNTGHSGWWTRRRKRNNNIRYHFICCRIK